MNKLLVIASLIPFGNSILAAATIMLSITTDIDPQMAGYMYEVATGTYKRAKAGDSIKVITATDHPFLVIDHLKKDYPNDMLKRKALKRFEGSIIEVLGQALRANKGRKASARISAPRLARQIRNYVDGADTTLIVIGSTLWADDPAFSFIDKSKSQADLRLRRPSHGSIHADKFLSPFSMKGVPELSGCRVIWLDPTGDSETDDDAYKADVADFWNCMFDAIGVPMSPIQSNAGTVVDMAFRKKLDLLKLKFDSEEEGSRMLTVRELRPEQVFYTNAKGFTHAWCADLSPSQSKVREAMARKLSDARGVKGQHHGLFIFETDGGILYSESSNVLEIAAAFRQVKPQGGADSMGSFSATLKKVRDELKLRKARNSTINILSDVAPSIDESTPESERYPAILRDILSDGHTVTFVRTNRKLDVRDFIPRDIKIKIVDL